MASLDKNDVTRMKEKKLLSKRFQWVLGTIIVAAVLFTVYLSGYVSSQQAYYNDRAFRLLSSMADKFMLHVQIADNVLRASATFENAQDANRYIVTVLHGKIQNDRDFLVTDLQKIDKTAEPNRTGKLTLFIPEDANSFRVRADYREVGSKAGIQPDNTKIPAAEEPCASAPVDIKVCATINFDPLVRSSFHDLEEGFFDDVLVADSEGNVLYQESPQGARIQNLNGLQVVQQNDGSAT